MTPQFKPLETWHLDWLSGWERAKREFTCVAVAYYIQEPGRSWKKWHVHSTLSDSLAWKYQHALKIHGPNPGNMHVPPLQIELPEEAKTYAEELKAVQSYE